MSSFQAHASNESTDVGAFGLVEIMPGVRHLLEYAAVRPGEHVLVLTEYAADRTVVEGIAAGAAFLGATVSVLAVPTLSAGGAAPDGPTPVTVAAWQEADVVISAGWWPDTHHRELFFPVIAGMKARYVGLQQVATAAALTTSARIAPAIIYAIKDVVLEQFGAADEITVTTPAGTALTMTGNRVDAVNGPLSADNPWSPFPYGGLNWSPSSGHGVLVVEESTLSGAAGAEGLTLEFHDGRVTSMRGRYRRDMEVFGPDGYYLRHATIGLNPKVRWQNAAQLEREKRSGTFYLGVDQVTPGGFAEAGGAHVDCQTSAATVTVDGRPVIRDGHLLALDDPRVRAVAAEFGDPDRLLVANPWVW